MSKCATHALIISFTVCATMALIFWSAGNDFVRGLLLAKLMLGEVFVFVMTFVVSFLIMDDTNDQ